MSFKCTPLSFLAVSPPAASTNEGTPAGVTEIPGRLSLVKHLFVRWKLFLQQGLFIPMN